VSFPVNLRMVPNLHGMSPLSVALVSSTLTAVLIARSAAPPYVAPRTPWGDPDLLGVWADAPISAPAPSGRRRSSSTPPTGKFHRSLQMPKPARPGAIAGASARARSAISYEMVHDTRIVPLDGRPHPHTALQLYLGDARGRWEGTQPWTMMLALTSLRGSEILPYER
jgi:hypothetical protein